MERRDPGLDNLLFLNGFVQLIGDGSYWYSFEAKLVPATAAKPHGIDYSLALHGPGSGDPSDSRLIGFDNAHAVKASAGPGGKRQAWDHKHRLRTVQPYDYTDAGALLADFYAAAERMLDERGVKR